MNVDQERVRHLLTETVILLCKNGLKFRTNVKVQGLLGITLDNTDIFLVQIDERIYEPLNTDLLNKEDDKNASTRTQLQTTNCFEPTKQKAGTDQDWTFDEQNLLASTVIEVENVNNEAKFQDSEVCNTFSNTVSLSQEQSVRISRSTSGSISHIKSENYEDMQMDSVPLKQQNSGMYATKSTAPLPVIVSCRTSNAVNMNKSTRLVQNRSQGLSETFAFSGFQKNKRKFLKERTDTFSPSLMHVNPALQSAISEESCPSLEGINGHLYNTIQESRTILESSNCYRSLISPTSSLPHIHKNQSLNAHLSKVRPNRFRGSRSSTLSYISHENLEKLLLRREKTRLRVKKHRLKKKLALSGVKNEASE